MFTKVYNIIIKWYYLLTNLFDFINGGFMKKFLMMLVTAVALTGCGGGDTVDSYNVCRITSSSAALASDRAKDLKQCWSGLNIKSKNKALSVCQQEASRYMAREYLVGHPYEVQVTNDASCD